MPPLPPVTNALSLRFYQTLTEDTNVVNRMYFSYSGIILVSDANNICITAAGAWTTHLAPLLSQYQALVGVGLADLASSSAVEVLHSVSTPGTVNTAAMPNQVCMNIKFQPVRRYRGGKPKWFQSGLPTGAAGDTATWSSTTTNAWSVAMTQFINAILAFSSTDVTLENQINISYYHGFTAVQNPITGRWRNVPLLRSVPDVDVIQGISAEPRFGSQRRRRV